MSDKLCFTSKVSSHYNNDVLNAIHTPLVTSRSSLWFRVSPCSSFFDLRKWVTTFTRISCYWCEFLVIGFVVLYLETQNIFTLRHFRDMFTRLFVLLTVFPSPFPAHSSASITSPAAPLSGERRPLVLAELAGNRLSRWHDGNAGLWSYHGTAERSRADKTTFVYNADLVGRTAIERFCKFRML